MPVIIDEVRTTVDAPSSQEPPAPPSAGAEASTSSRLDIARTLRRIARREARLAAD